MKVFVQQVFLSDANHREVCIDYLHFDAEGKIKPVKISFDGVKTQTLER